MEKKEIQEIKEMLKKEFIEQTDTKKVIADKKNNQFSIKIPKDLATKSLLNEKSNFKFVFHPSTETLEQIKKSNLIIYLEEQNDK